MKTQDDKSQEESTDKQHKEQYDWLKQYQFQKGQSGNLEGRPPGKSLKAFVKETLEKMNEEDKAVFLKKLDPKFVWAMGEGNPPQKVDLDANVHEIHELESQTAEILKNLYESGSSKSVNTKPIQG